MIVSRCTCTIVIAILVSVMLCAETATSPLELTGKIPLPSVAGRVDHLAADLHHGRLFIAALGNNSVEVLDVRTNSLMASISGVLEPQGIAYVHAANRLFVASGGDGSVRIFDGSTLKAVGSLRLGRDADNIRVDTTQGRVYVGYGDGGLAVLSFSGKRLADIALKGHPESFQLAEKRPRIFINVPDSHVIAVVDADSFKILAEWPITDALDNFPMALDEPNRRVFVACRRPARLLVLDMDSGHVLAQLPTVGDADDVFYDPIHARVYVIGGQGQVAVYGQQTPDRYSNIDAVATVAGARTGLFVSEWDRLFVAVRDFAGHPAEVRIYQPK
jgi:YVTN family beta-propeller protein